MSNSYLHPHATQRHHAAAAAHHANHELQSYPPMQSQIYSYQPHNVVAAHPPSAFPPFPHSNSQYQQSINPNTSYSNQLPHRSISYVDQPSSFQLPEGSGSYAPGSNPAAPARKTPPQRFSSLSRSGSSNSLENSPASGSSHSRRITASASKPTVHVSYPATSSSSAASSSSISNPFYSSSDPTSPYSKDAKKKRRGCCDICTPNCFRSSSLVIRFRTWWKIQSDIVRSAVLAVSFLAVIGLLILFFLSGAPDAIMGSVRNNQISSNTLLSRLPSTQLKPGEVPLLQRLRKYVKKLGRDVGLLDRPNRKLGEFGVFGAAGRMGLPQPPPGSPLGADAFGAPPPATTPIMSWLLSKSYFDKHLTLQAEEAVRAREENAAVAAKATGAASATAVTNQWVSNPWFQKQQASITLFTTFPDLNLKVTPGSAAAGSADPNSPQSSALTLHLLVLSSWVQLIPADKIHLFVNNAETCLVLLGHDGSTLGRDSAMSMTPVNPLAGIHCHTFPCVHPRFRRGLMSCVWNDMSQYAADELQVRKFLARKGKETELQALRESRATSAETGKPALDAKGLPILYSLEAEEEFQQQIDAIELEDEVLLYLSPTIMFDMQLVTTLSKLYQDSLATQAIIREIKKNTAVAQQQQQQGTPRSSTPRTFPSQGLDVNGDSIPDTGNFFVVGRRTDIVVPKDILGHFQPNPQDPNAKKDAPAPTVALSAVSTSGVFHSPASGFTTTLLDSIELLWKLGYSKFASFHSGYGLDFMALRLNTYEQLRDHHITQSEKMKAEAEDEAEFAANDLHGRAAMLQDEASVTLAAVSTLPSSSFPQWKNQPTFFPPFLAGLFRWENWFVSKMILADAPFHTKVVDVSASLTLLHVEVRKSTTVGNSGVTEAESTLMVEGAKYNEALVKAVSDNAYRIGSVDFAPFQLIGSCVIERNPRERAQKGSNTYFNPSTGGTNAAGEDSSHELAISPTVLPPLCLVQPRPVSNFTNLYWFTKQASKAPLHPNYIVVLTVNSGYMKLALNWLCWSRRIKFENFILLAEDQLSARVFRALGAPVIVPADAAEDLPPSDYGSVEFQRTMSFRTEFLMSVLIAGFHFVTADMDAIWFDNPIASFDPLADLSGQTHKGYKLSGGFIVVRSTPYGRFFWNRVIECQRMNAIFLKEHKIGTYEPSQYTEQYCINELSLGLEKKPTTPPFVRTLLDPYGFPDGKSFFDQQNSQYRGVWPSVIHNNWIMGADGKFDRMTKWGMVSIAPADKFGKGGMEKAMDAAKRIHDMESGQWSRLVAQPPDLAVCTDEPIVQREPIPSVRPSSSSVDAATAAAIGATSLSTSPPQVHQFHMHIRLFLSDIGSDGVEQQGEFDNLKRIVKSIIDTDFNDVIDSKGRAVKPALHVELMLDHLSSSTGEAAEFERLKLVLKYLKQAWIEQFGTPESNGYSYVFEIKRPKSLGVGEKRKVGRLGLWLMPWPKVAGSMEERESRELQNIDISETPLAAHQGFKGDALSASSINEAHHDVSLYLHDSVQLSASWFQYAYPMIDKYYFAEENTPANAADTSSTTSSEIDPRIYGISLLDSHEIYGENRDRSYVASPSYVNSRFNELAYFNKTGTTWRKVKQQALKASGADTSTDSNAAAAIAAMSQSLPTFYLDHKVFGYQYLSHEDALILFPQHFTNFVSWIAKQNILDTASSEAAPLDLQQAAASKCIPTLYSNKFIQTLPHDQTWKEWINRWSYERGFYALHNRMKLIKVVQPSTIPSTTGSTGPAVPKPVFTEERFAVALTDDQRKNGKEVKLVERFTSFDLHLPSLPSLPTYDFHLVSVRQPITLPHRHILAPADVVDPCYTMDQLKAKDERNEKEEQRKLEEERARRKVEKEKKKAEEAAAKAAAAELEKAIKVKMQQDAKQKKKK